MTDRRIITCEDCYGAGGHYITVDFYDDHGVHEDWLECPLCEGYGYLEVPAQPITQADLAANCPAGPYIVEDDSE